MRTASLLFLILSLNFASLGFGHMRPILVNSIVYSDTSCRYFSTNSGEFTFYYPLERAPQDVREFVAEKGIESVKTHVHYGFRESFHQNEWMGEANSTAMTLAKADEIPGVIVENMLRTRVTAQVAARGSYFFKDLQFVIHFELADGRKFSDNGTQVPFGSEYEITLPNTVCDQEAPRVIAPARINVRSN